MTRVQPSPPCPASMICRFIAATEDGLIHREAYPQVPPKVEFSLTEDGAALNAALGPLGEWGRERIRRERLAVVDEAGATRHDPLTHPKLVDRFVNTGAAALSS